jgi:hypothetical protein
MSYSLTIPLALGSSQTGLTLRANLKDTTGGAIGGNVTTGFVELGAGNYEWTGTIPNGFQGAAVFSNNSSGAVLACTTINPADDPATLAAVKAKTDGLNFAGALVRADAQSVGGIDVTDTTTGTNFFTFFNNGDNPSALQMDTMPAAVWVAGGRTLTGFSFTIDANPVTLAANQDVRNVTGSVTGAVTVGALNDGIITDAKFTMPAEANGRPSTFMAIVRRLLELMPGGNKRNRNRDTGDVELRNAADTGNLQTWQQSTDGTVDTESKGT